FYVVWQGCEIGVHIQMESQNLALVAPLNAKWSNFFLPYPALAGCHVCWGFRQSIPSSRYDICPAVRATAPSAVTGHTNRPR
ncbi:hypothetical protein, partial [Escherichia coli]|uniref:hypothetical protein n=1 Tax=Escherichia coli TaxID=562 RepID=UPI003EB77893